MLSNDANSRKGVPSRLLFSPLGKFADRGYIFYLPNFFLSLKPRLIISGSIRPIFAIFSPYDRVFGETDGSEPLFSIPERTLPWQPIFGKTGKMIFIQQAGFRNG